jgi:membrane-bound metal-dependent hydrolase YbcI (DUF457 family)
MTDLLTHVLAAYVLARVAVWRLDWLADRHVALAMLGATVPDAAKLYLLLGGIRHTIAGVEVSLLALQTVGAALAFVAIGGLLVPPRERRPALSALTAGVVLHVALDYLVVRTGGRSPPYLYPLTWGQLPPGNLYLSADVWPSLVALVAAAAVWLLDRRLPAGQGRSEARD